MGWIDKGALWSFDLQTQTETRIVVDGSKYLTLSAGANGLFRLVHHESPDEAISIRRVQEPALELASVRFNKNEMTFSGDFGLWRHVDPAVIINTGSETKLLLIDALQQRVIDLDLTWYTSANYDLMYQGLTDCISLEAIDRVVVSVQRSSKLVIIDPKRNERVGSIDLGDRYGNPKLRRRTPSDFLASDYDTLCRVDSHSLAVLNTARLQGASAPYERQFIGDYDIGVANCAVARPFSGDVLLVAPDDFKVLGRAPIGGEPHAVCLISESDVLTRDWKTGRVAIGQFGIPDSQFRAF